MNRLHEKYEALKEYIKSLGSVAVAFSSGVDSTLLLKVAHDVLGDKAIAVTARSCSFPERELKEAAAFAQANGIVHIVVDSEELEIEGFCENPVNRCYLCKHELFSKMKEIAGKEGLQEVVEGSNMDDLGDYRPGLEAVRELGVKSPLRYAQLSKDEIRELSKELGLPTWEKQSFACLSSRFPYGESITVEKLKMVDQAEQLLLDLGFRQVRVRHHDPLARIEISEDQFSKIMKKEIRDQIFNRFREIGFTYVALDLAGYRTGSMNEVLNESN
ncbi:MAG TPA: ATP-dependent sacrificial sulfur transferase LarE [Anaerovoracaceae bacterium]|nr:ATP-dependent sacrificial sulfur transferase LarE [Anaerovoracaceae bacterium]